jgi:hypothetical protein
LYALNAPPSILQSRYDDNKTYQRELLPTEDKIVKEMLNQANLKQFRGQDKYYPDFLAYYQSQINVLGVEKCVNEALFSRDELAEDLLARLFAG